MTELALIMVSAILVNNFVLVQFSDLHPCAKRSQTAETTAALTLSAMCNKPCRAPI